MARKRRKKFKKIKYKLNPKLILIAGISIGAILLLGGLGYICFTTPAFRISEENIISNTPLSKGIKERIEGQFLFNLDLKSISAVLSKDYPEYKQVYVFKQFPSSVVIKVDQRTPIAQIKAKKFYPLDQEAIVLSAGSPSEAKGLITIEIGDSDRFFQKGETIDDQRLRCAFDLLGVFRDEEFIKSYEVNLINVTSLPAAYFLIKIKDSEATIKVIIGESDFSQRIDIFNNLIAKDLKDKISLINYIDLRYKKVYVGFKR